MDAHDLTHPVETGMQTYPGDPAVKVTPAAEIDADGFRVSALELGTHSGTHVDAPSHTEPDGATLGEFDVGAFRFDARLVDLRDCDAREAVGVDRVAASAAAEADAVVLHTGWDRRWGTAAYLDHPYLTGEAAAWCAENGLHVATDALNVDPTPRPDGDAPADEPDGVPAHREILGAGLLILENLRGLDRLPDRFTLAAYPLAVDADGAPVRAVGLVSDP